ncbi:MAG: hypothetical protein H6907_12300 [Hyphomicrobiales bacterium]|nr:hypothetical protein [Hyphomicrobiales bacterium]
MIAAPHPDGATAHMYVRHPEARGNALRRFLRHASDVVWCFVRVALPKGRRFDQVYHVLYFLLTQHRFPRLRNPRTLNEHLFRLKMSGTMSDPLRRRVSDKVLVKEFIRERAGAHYPETLACCNSFESFLATDLPERCVIKPAHASGRVVYADGPLDRAALDEVRSWFDLNYYDLERELNYRDLEKRVIVEELLGDGITPPKDYKVFCFDGEPQFVQVDDGRFTDHTRNLYTTDWRMLPVRWPYANHAKDERPESLAEIVRLSRLVAAEFDFIRVDFYVTDGRVLIGELTNLPANASQRFLPQEVDGILGNLFTGKVMRDIERKLFALGGHAS